MSQVAQTPEPPPESPPLDPYAIRRAYRRERLRRRAKRDHRREQKLAGMRFVVFIFVLLALSVFITLTAWHEVQRLFGI
jgi:hypothetical protein